MKKSNAFFFLILFCSISVIGQSKLFSDLKKDSVIRLDPQQQQFDYVPGELIVKFRDNVSIRFIKSGGLLKTGISSLDDLVDLYGIHEGEKLFPNEKKIKTKQILTAINGNTFERPSLHNIFKLKLKSAGNLLEIIKSFEEDTTNVVYSEPNYILSVTDDKPLSPKLSDKEIKTLYGPSLKPKIEKQISSPPNDPLFSDQWYISAINADIVWEQATGTTNQIIAILDTGVDWLHPDLQNKIWNNTDEIPDNGKDDDGNGKVDDVRGWDWINHDNNPTDDNSHGTHVAGIAAAETNNGIGMAGVNWNAQIMPLKVFQSSGRGDAATISQAIIYASNKGATVINMSFGSYAHSLSQRDALANAYANTLLVAAAGNDGRGIGPCMGCAPFFPAALSFVLGVESPEAGFSNYDQDGPTFSWYSELWNYEIKAPGTNVISTIPGGRYRVYQGTSMATPLISGVLCLYRQLIPPDEETHEFMWVKLIQAIDFWLDLELALTIEPVPEVWFLNNVMVDTLANADRDGRVDTGETIELWFKARNTGGQVDSVFWKIQLGEFEDPTTCQIIKNTSFIGSISPYATRTSENDPMVFKISPDVAHDRDITFELLSWFKGSADTVKNMFVFTPENGEELFDVLDSTRILYPNKLYLVNRSFKVGENGHLIIKPGTKLLIYPGKTIVVSGKITAIGKPDSLIYISGYLPPPNTNGNVNEAFQFRNNEQENYFKYCRFERFRFMMNANSGGIPPSLYNCDINVSDLGRIDSIVNCDCYFTTRGYGSTGHIYDVTYAYKNNFRGISTSDQYFFDEDIFYISYGGKYKFNNLINYRIQTSPDWTDQTMQNAWISEYKKDQRYWNGTYYQNTERVYQKYRAHYQNTNDYDYVKYQYWGTSDSTKIEESVYDFMEDPTYPRVKFEPYLNAPPDSCHGLVWKILVNGIDPQDGHLDALGVGKHRFDVYFNRPMDTTYTPNLGFGVRYPFSSNAVDENPFWSNDGRIWTAYSNIKLYTGDGINRIRVSGARDLEGWEIPIEDMRFEFLISAAESSSLDFMAQPGLGKVDLEWNNIGLEDLLGFNMYRMEHINDTTLTQPELANEILIIDTVFTDYDVIPNKKYYYFYKVVRTNFAESDSSRVVSSTPFTSSLGDANGDLNVNVLDLTTIVAYILEQDPEPFLMDAADVNYDRQINVLDIISIVQLISGTKSTVSSFVEVNNIPAYIYLNDGIIQLDSDNQIAAMQFELVGENLENIRLFSLLNGFEFSYGIVDDKILGIIYSFSGNLIPEGLQDIIRVENSIGDLTWGEVFGGDLMGNYVNIFTNKTGGIEELTFSENDIKVYPNPFNTSITINYQIKESSIVNIDIYNIKGQKVKTLKSLPQTVGQYEIIWNGTNMSNQSLPSGIYFCRMIIRPVSNADVFVKDVKLVRIK